MNDKNKKKADQSGHESSSDTNVDEETTVTERTLEREEEDEKYVPVIVKRSDEAFRHPDDTLQKAIKEGMEQMERHFLSLSLSSTAGGMILGFTAMVVAIVTAGMAPFDQPFIERIAVSMVYPLGFVICIMSGTQLFTEHTATAVYPVLDRKKPVSALLRLWLVVVVFNLVGAAISGALLSLADGVVHAKTGYIIIADHLVGYSTFNLLISAILAGWLMALGAWLIMATQPTMSQIICIYIVTFIIGLGGLHHSIAGSVEMFAALFVSDQYTIDQAARFIGLAVLGNLIGGSVFVALLNYGHIRKTQELSED
jgi:formate/nitrite transporter FocA (FNT family)